jgi:hypothetical protein
VGPAGEVLVAGTGSRDHFLLKYDADGNLLWHSTVPSRCCAGSDARVQVGQDGTVYFGGTVYYWFNGVYCVDQDYVVARFTADGEQMWIEYYDGLGRDDTLKAMALDDDGLIYVTGTREDSSAINAFATLVFGPDGEFLAEHLQYNGLGVSLALDQQQHLFVAGTLVNPGNEQIGLVKYCSPVNACTAR